MALTSLLSLRTEILLRVDDATNGYFSTSEVNNLINRSGRQLVSKLATQGGVRHRICRGVITMIPTTERYSWPSLDTYTGEGGQTLMQLLGVTALFGTQQRQRLGRMSWNNRERYVNSTANWTYGADIAYEYDPNAILFYPTPNRVVQVEILFVPPWKELGLDLDTYNGINGFDTWIVANVCAQAAAKESDTEQMQFYMNEREAVWADMIALATTTDEGDAGVMVDMEGYLGGPLEPAALEW